MSSNTEVVRYLKLERTSGKPSRIRYQSGTIIKLMEDTMKFAAYAIILGLTLLLVCRDDSQENMPRREGRKLESARTSSSVSHHKRDQRKPRTYWYLCTCSTPHLFPMTFREKGLLQRKKVWGTFQIPSKFLFWPTLTWS